MFFTNPINKVELYIYLAVMTPAQLKSNPTIQLDSNGKSNS